jgi:hypothetical protein
MHLPTLLSGPGRGVGLLRVLLVATGFRNAYWLLGAALVVTVVYHDGAISRVGPIQLFPELKVMVVVPTLLATACAVAHGTTGSPVVVRNARVLVLRAVSYGTVLTASVCVLLLGARLADDPAFPATMRNLLWLVGVATATAALCGLLYAWFPVMLALTTTIVSPVSDSDWSLFGFFFRDSASSAQLTVATVLAAVGIAVAVWDPRSLGYLRIRREPRTQTAPPVRHSTGQNGMADPLAVPFPRERRE